MAGFAGKININSTDYPIASTLYGTCTTSAGTAAKIVTLADFDTLLPGVTVAVKFTYSNTAANPTLNVNGTGALPIYTDGTNAPGTTPQESWAANSVVYFTYDGSAWMMSDFVGSMLSSFRAALLNTIYPVGAIYMSTNNTNPGTMFGGTWSQIKDKFLLSAGDNYSAGSSGGSATKNLQHKHTTAGHTLTVSEIPSHTHSERIEWSDTPGKGQIVNWTASGTNCCVDVSGLATGATGGGGSHSHGDTGNNLSTTQDIMPPYLVVYVWKRTA